MRVLWISVNLVGRQEGGGSVYSEGLQRAMAIAVPDIEICELGAPGPEKMYLVRRLRRLMSFARSLVDWRSSSAINIRHRRVANQIRQIVASQRPDLTIFDTSESMVYRDIAPGPALLVAHNVEGDIFAMRVAGLPQPIRGIVTHGLKEIEKHRRFERQGTRTLDGVIAISAADRSIFADWIPDRPVVQILPCCGPASAAGTCAGKRSDNERIRVVFPAKFSWPPNSGRH